MNRKAIAFIVIAGLSVALIAALRVGNRADLEEGAMKGIELGDLQIAVYNVDGEFYATDNICTHAFALLSDGFLDGDVVECPLHGGGHQLGHLDEFFSDLLQIGLENLAHAGVLSLRFGAVSGTDDGTVHVHCYSTR